MYTQLSLFPENELEYTPVIRKKTNAGKTSSDVFHDYEGFIAKFRDLQKTTDDTYTPKDVYEAVLWYVDSIYPLQGKQIIRPFYPGGDYENAEYPEDGVVIDNPPFSIFTKIVRFYALHNIPFFLFGPAMSIFSVLKCQCSAVIVSSGVIFENGADVNVNFATNLLGDTLVTTSCELSRRIELCNRNKKNIKPKPVYGYPEEVLSVSFFQCIAKGNIDFSVRRYEAEIIKKLDNHPKGSGGLFSEHLLVSHHAAHAAAEAKARAAAEAKARADTIAGNQAQIVLSKREHEIVGRLDNAVCSAGGGGNFNEPNSISEAAIHQHSTKFQQGFNKVSTSINLLQ